MPNGVPVIGDVVLSPHDKYSENGVAKYDQLLCDSSFINEDKYPLLVNELDETKELVNESSLPSNVVGNPYFTYSPDVDKYIRIFNRGNSTNSYSYSDEPEGTWTPMLSGGVISNNFPSAGVAIMRRSNGNLELHGNESATRYFQYGKWRSSDGTLEGTWSKVYSLPNHYCFSADVNSDRCIAGTWSTAEFYYNDDSMETGFTKDDITAVTSVAMQVGFLSDSRAWFYSTNNELAITSSVDNWEWESYGTINESTGSTTNIKLVYIHGRVYMVIANTSWGIRYTEDKGVTWTRVGLDNWDDLVIYKGTLYATKEYAICTIGDDDTVTHLVDTPAPLEYNLLFPVMGRGGEEILYYVDVYNRKSYIVNSGYLTPLMDSPDSLTPYRIVADLTEDE